MLNQTFMPVLVFGRRWDVLAWNLTARAFFFDFEKVSADERNLVWLIFTRPELRSMMVDWPTRAQDAIARFRADYGRYAGDPHFVELVQRLIAISPDFAEYWPRHDLRQMSEGSSRYRHPVAGNMVVDFMIFSVVDKPEQRVTVFSPSSKEDSIGKMRTLVEVFGSAESDRHSVAEGEQKEQYKV
jgi:hypothetical protein